MVTLKNWLRSVDIIVRNDTYCDALNPKISAYSSNGRKAVLKIIKIVYMDVFHMYPLAKEIGWVRLMSLSTITPKIKLTIADVAVIAY